jgi:DNA-directed RNA polymerase specialized sigma24 family protein
VAAGATPLRDDPGFRFLPGRLGSTLGSRRSASHSDDGPNSKHRLPLSTTYRLAAELEAWRALDRVDHGQYRIGMRLWEAGLLAPVWSRVREVALPFLPDLFESTRENVHLAVRDGFDTAEDAMQEALLAAAEQFPDADIPASPRARLITVAARRLTDLLRSEQARRRREEQWRPVEEQHATDTDDTLILPFLCCHPALSPPSQIALTLRAVGGLTTGEITRLPRGHRTGQARDHDAPPLRRGRGLGGAAAREPVQHQTPGRGTGPAGTLQPVRTRSAVQRPSPRLHNTSCRTPRSRTVTH